MNIYIQFQDSTGCWRIYHVTQNIPQLIVSSMKNAKNVYPNNRIRAVNENGNIVDIL